MFELRLDHLPNLREAQLSRLRRPLILTARHPLEGGMRCDRKCLLRRFLPYGQFIDIELRSMRELHEPWEEARRRRTRRICSVHNFKCTPELSILKQQLLRARKSGADIFKLVTRADTLRDLLILFEFLWANARLMRLCVMAIGKFGPISRLLLPEAGSIFIYAPVLRPLYQGQLTIAQLRGLQDF